MEKVNASVHKTEPLFPLSSGLGIHVNRPHLCILHKSQTCFLLMPYSDKSMSHNEAKRN